MLNPYKPNKRAHQPQPSRFAKSPLLRALGFAAILFIILLEVGFIVSKRRNNIRTVVDELEGDNAGSSSSSPTEGAGETQKQQKQRFPFHKLHKTPYQQFDPRRRATVTEGEEVARRGASTESRDYERSHHNGHTEHGGEMVDPSIYAHQVHRDGKAMGQHPNFPHGAPLPKPHRVPPNTVSEEQKEIVKMLQHAWRAYKRAAFGHDELKPISQTWIDWGSHEGASKTVRYGIGITAIEALDTLWLMGLYDEFDEVVKFLKTNHTWDVPVEVSVFETTIRCLGGLLSAYELSGVPSLLDSAYDLGDRLIYAFGAEGSNVIPVANVNLKGRRPSHPVWMGTAHSLSEVTTIQLEFKKLSYHTGYIIFDELAQACMQHVLKWIDHQTGGLYPMDIKRSDGSPIDGKITLGGRGDSFYEYIAKQAAITSMTEPMYLDAWDTISHGIKTYLQVKIDRSRLFIAEAAYSRGTGRYVREYVMDHLVCFLVGAFAVGRHGNPTVRREDYSFAQGLGHTCDAMYSMSKTGLGPEIVRFRNDETLKMYAAPGAHHYLLRPEALEAMFYLSRMTPDPTWKDAAIRMSKAIEKNCRIEKGGYSGIHDVMRLNSPFNDKMDSYFIAETLKYAFLAAVQGPLAERQLSVKEWVFNTEGHPLRIIPGPLTRRKKKP